MSGNPYVKLWTNEVASLGAGADGIVAWVALQAALSRQGLDDDAARWADGTPTTPAELARDIGAPADTVEAGLVALALRRRVVQEPDGAWAIPGWALSQLSPEARRQRRKRERDAARAAARDVSRPDPYRDRDTSRPKRDKTVAQPAPAPAPALKISYRETQVRAAPTVTRHGREPWGAAWASPPPAQPWHTPGLAAPEPRPAPPALALVEAKPKRAAKAKPKRAKHPPTNEVEELADRVLAYLNERRRELVPSARGFDFSPGNRKEICARIREGADEALLRAAIDGRIAEAAAKGGDFVVNVNPQTPFYAARWARSLALAEAIGNAGAPAPYGRHPETGAPYKSPEDRADWERILENNRRRREALGGKGA